MAREKKFLSPVIRSYGDDIAKRWRVEYWQHTHNGSGGKRIVDYGDINKGKTVEERYKLAYALINSYDFRPKAKQKNIIELAMDDGALDWRPKTYSTYNTVATTFTDYLKNAPPETVSESVVNAFLLQVRKKDKDPSTISKYKSILHLLYNRAIALKLTKYNPVPKPQQARCHATSLLFFTDKQIEQFKGAEKDDQLWLAVQLLFYCFIRPGEIRCLRVADINFEYRFIEINAKFSKNKKTEKVAIPDTLYPYLEFLSHYPKSFYIISRNGGPGTEQIAVNWLYNTHVKLLAKLKIKGRYSFYSWKHTGVVKAVRAGINIKDLQLQLRHHSLDMVNEYLKNLGVLDSEDLRKKYPAL